MSKLTPEDLRRFYDTLVEDSMKPRPKPVFFCNKDNVEFWEEQFGPNVEVRAYVTSDIIFGARTDLGWEIYDEAHDITEENWDAVRKLTPRRKRK